MITRRTAIVAGLFLSSFIATASRAAEVQEFDAAAFAAAQKSGKSILLEITAPWCPVCAKQKPIIGAVGATDDFGALKIFTIDFDSQKPLLATLRVSKQSTLITFKGDVEKDRSTGATDAKVIEQLMRTAL